MDHAWRRRRQSDEHRGLQKENDMNNNNVIPTRLIRAIFLALLLALPLISHAETYAYDAAGRLTGVTYDNGSSIAYAYDKNGNILSKSIIVVRVGMLDVDANGVSDANDGVMILRRLNGADTVTTGIVLTGGATNASVIANIDGAGVGFDVDGNAKSDANDGVMIVKASQRRQHGVHRHRPARERGRRRIVR